MIIRHRSLAAYDPDSDSDSDSGGTAPGMVAIVHQELTKNEDGDVERVEFDRQSGKARVKQEIGEQLVDHYENIEAVDEGEK